MILTNFEDDLPQLTEDKINNYDNSFEWWYFDLDCESEISLVMIFKRKDTFTHKINPSIYVEYKIGNKYNTLVKILEKDEFKVKNIDGDKGAIITFGSNYVKLYKDNKRNVKSYDLHIDFNKFRVDAEINPIHQGFKLREDGAYFIHKKEHDLMTCVNFASPRIEGKGSLTLFGKNYDFSGEGYHDHPWGTVNLLQTNKNWHWARLFNNFASILYADVIPHSDYEGNLKFFYYSYFDKYIPKIEKNYEIESENWKSESGSKLKFPHNLKIMVPNLKLDIITNYNHVLLNIKIYNRSQVNFKLNDNGKNSISEGIGWTEYWNVPSWMRGLLIKMNKLEQIRNVKKTKNLMEQ